ILQPIFIDGRAVEPVGDTLVAFTLSGAPGFTVRDRRTNSVRVLGADILQGPVHLQSLAGRWYVSEVSEGAPAIAVLDADGTLEDRIDLAPFDATPHQFAVLPDGGIVVEAPGGLLLTLGPTEIDTFTITDQAESRTGLLVAASGGLLHAVPDHHITLYNGFGNIRWRIEWPWAETAFVSDLSFDVNGRPHVIAGIARTDEFRVYSLSVLTGEVIRWSGQEPNATFLVERWGELKPDIAENWIN
ncbi:MAG: hypothetical protein ACE5FJ_12490, partial [Gemmatimonadales bacterium]